MAVSLFQTLDRLILPLGKSDGVCTGRKMLVGLSPARETMAALRAVGVLAEVVETTEGLVVYPAGLEAGTAVLTRQPNWRRPYQTAAAGCVCCDPRWPQVSWTWRGGIAWPTYYVATKEDWEI